MYKLINSWPQIMTITLKDWKSLIYNKGVYISVCLSLIISAIIVNGYFRFIDDSSFLIMNQPLNLPLIICVIICSGYLAIISSTSISRERDRGTLETLFFGPVNAQIYILAKFLSHLLIYIFMVLLISIFLTIVVSISGLFFSIQLFWSILLSILSGACITSYGIFLSSITKNIRTSLLFLVGSFLIAGGIMIAHRLFSSIPVDTLSSSMTYVRSVINGLNQVVDIIFPIAYLERGLNAIDTGDTNFYLFILISSLLYFVILLIFSSIVFRFKGVRKP